MRGNESQYPNDWFAIGDKDLIRAVNLFELNDFEGTGFNIQQAIEKYLKGFLLSRGWKLRKIHNLETLLNDVIYYDPSFEKFRKECLRITYYYIQERYPLAMGSALTKKEVKKSLQVAQAIIHKIQKLLLSEDTYDK